MVKNLYLRKLGFPISLLLAATVCIQIHASVYWEMVLGSSGLLFSLTIETVAIAFWIYSKMKKGLFIVVIAALASTLSFVAPALKNIDPVINEYQALSQKISMWEIKSEMLEASSLALKENWDRDMVRADKRPGWAPSIQQSRDLYFTSQEAVLEHMSYKPGTVDLIQSNIPIFSILLAIFVMQCGSVILARLIGDELKVINSKNSVINSNRDESAMQYQGIAGGYEFDESQVEEVELTALHETEADGIKANKLSLVSSNSFDTTDDLILYAAKEVRIYMDAKNYSNTELGRAISIAPRDLSLLLNHEKKLEDRKSDSKVRVVSEDKTKEILEKCGISVPNTGSKAIC